MKMRFCAAAVAALALTGCAATYRLDSRPIEIGPGAKPSPAATESAVRGYLSRALKDPDSLKQFQILGDPTIARWHQGLLNGDRWEAAWMVCFEYNAKNSFGGYVGLKRDRVMLRGDSPDHVLAVPAVNWAAVTTPCP